MNATTVASTNKSTNFFAASFFFAFIFLAAHPASAQTQPASSKVPVTTVVTVLGPNYSAPPPLAKEDVNVYRDKLRETVTGWVPAQGGHAPLQLAIVVDDVVGSDIGNQLNDIRNFIRAQAKETSVGVFYANNGVVQTASSFTEDHDAAAQKLRIPIGEAGASTSIYLALMDLISKWPASSSRREIFLIADGIDRFRGDPNSPDVPATIEKAQKAGIMIHSIYAKVVGRVNRNFFRANYGQSNLAQMADETGGESFTQGLDTPISFAPYLEQLDMVLHNQYFLTFTTARSTKRKGEFRSFRIRTEEHNAEISSARAVFVPGP